MRPASVVDLTHRLLHHFGWSVGEAVFKLPDGNHYWQVDASRNGHVIIATANSQAKAWWECCRMAGVVERDAVWPLYNCRAGRFSKVQSIKADCDRRSGAILERRFSRIWQIW